MVSGLGEHDDRLKCKGCGITLGDPASQELGFCTECRENWPGIEQATLPAMGPRPFPQCEPAKATEGDNMGDAVGGSASNNHKGVITAKKTRACENCKRKKIRCVHRGDVVADNTTAANVPRSLKRKRGAVAVEQVPDVKGDADKNVAAVVGADIQNPPPAKRPRRVRFGEVSIRHVDGSESTVASEPAPTEPAQPSPAQQPVPEDTSSRQPQGRSRKRKFTEEEQAPADSEAAAPQTVGAADAVGAGTVDGNVRPRKLRVRLGGKPSERAAEAVSQTVSVAAQPPVSTPAAASTAAADATGATGQATVEGPLAPPPRKRRGRKPKSEQSSSAARPPVSAPAAAVDAPVPGQQDPFPFPLDNLEGAALLSRHAVLSRELQERLDDARVKWQIAMDALQAAKDAMDTWAEAFRRGQ